MLRLMLHLPKRSCLGRSLADRTAGLERDLCGASVKGWHDEQEKGHPGVLQLTSQMEQAAPHMLKGIDRYR
jgi:hypothetical protein